MKKFLFLLVISVSLFSCRSEVDPLFTMNMEVEFEIPAGLGSLLTHTFVIRDVKSPLESYLTTFGGDSNSIASIQAGRGELTALFSASNYQFVNRVSVWMVSSENPDIRKELYYLDFNNDNSNDGSLKLLSAVSNVQSIVDNDTFHMEVKLEFRSFSPTTIENRLIFSLVALE